jgi:hypothetical protein
MVSCLENGYEVVLLSCFQGSIAAASSSDMPHARHVEETVTACGGRRDEVAHEGQLFALTGLDSSFIGTPRTSKHRRIARNPRAFLLVVVLRD